MLVENASSWCGPVVTLGEDLGPQQDRLSPALRILHDPSVRAAQAAGGHWSGSLCGEGLGGDGRQPGRGPAASRRGSRALVCPGPTAVCSEPVAGMGGHAEGRGGEAGSEVPRLRNEEPRCCTRGQSRQEKGRGASACTCSLRCWCLRGQRVGWQWHAPHRRDRGRRRAQDRVGLQACLLSDCPRLYPKPACSCLPTKTNQCIIS